MIKIIKSLAKLSAFRNFVLKILKPTARDITIRNSWSSMPLLLNSWLHKGYWFYGADREAQTMMLFQKLISPGDTVIEIGGHIGFVSQYFSKLTGPTGKVIVFEPGSNNLPYIKKNTARCSNIFLETQAVSEKSGTAILYEDNISGQNNSLLADYHVADGVAQSHSLQLIKKKNHVNVTSLDDYLNDKSIIPKFIKIDIEGCELQALRGMGRVLKNVQSLMVEVSCNHDEVFKILSSEGFFIYNDLGETLLFAGPKFQGNVFALRSPLDL